MQGVTVSTAFSGIGAAEVALGTIERGLATAGMQELSVRSLFAVEINTECQTELQCLATKPDCIYADMVELIAPGIREHTREYGHRLRFDDLVQLAKKPKFAIAHASCMIHRSTCTAQCASLHVAGTPCVDYSSSGKRSGILGGTLLPFLAWVGQHRTLQEPAILHENVQQFAPELLDKFLGDMCIIQSCVFNAAVLGHACDRERRLTWMLHKGHVNVSPQNNWPESLPFFVRTCTFTWEAYCVSTAEEREEEIRWAARWDDQQGEYDAEEREQEAHERAREAAAEEDRDWDRIRDEQDLLRQALRARMEASMAAAAAAGAAQMQTERGCV